MYGQFSSCTCTSLAVLSHIRYLGVDVDKHLNWHLHIENLTLRLRKLIYIFKKLSHSADIDTLKLTYYALCQSLLSYCIVCWGGADRTTFLKLERAQRAVLKVMHCKPFRYPTKQLYELSAVLTVRQLFILHSVLRKHRTPFCASKKRHSGILFQTQPHRTAFAHKQCYFISSRLYNIVNRHIKIYSLNYHNCKQRLKNWLLTLDYLKTESLLS